ncbi:iron ABC transporter permease [Corynebacterium sp. HMSC11E11]|uniref:FecCD family ABC transporter permease n=1 Tax=Corynebacterium sp. HMSC11E11 TaxID=1581089 RepID=UPI0008A530A3|nr:iron ABC transporter permease [Corynebacterium sp. HMSC11E11]OFU53139.1 sugar ABC transporter substrate-binding protein [Corynebacterium sp. HMSC11E11]
MRSKAATPLLVFLLAALTAVSFVASLTFGSVSYSLSDVWSVLAAQFSGTVHPDRAVNDIVWELRAPRGLMAIIVGAGLAMAGVAMQTLVRNPLADPYLLGISSGASVGATAVITLGAFSSFGIWALSGGALVGAIAATATVYLVTMLQGGITPLRLILSGVVLSSAFSAVASLLVFKAPDSRSAQSVLFWMLGSVSGAQWDRLLLPLLVLVPAVILMFMLSPRLDALSAGPETAAALGVRVGLLRKVLFAVQALLVGAMVAVAGGIGFVGLVIPHFARLVVGSVHRRVIPVAVFGGALFLLWVDVLARLIAPPQEIPLGVVTGVIGAPVFLLLMGRSRYRFGGQS